MDIHQAHIDAFYASTEELFSTMIRMPVKMEASEFGTRGDLYDLSGTIKITGDIAGSVSVGFERDAALKFAEQLLGVPVGAKSADFADAVSEISNMIVGSAKSRMKNVSASIGCPEVVFHDAERLRASGTDVGSFILCTTEAGKFTIGIFLHASDLSKAK